MVYFKCLTCRTRLYDTGSPTNSVNDLCPICGALLEPVGELSEAVGFRSIKSRDIGAPGTHKRIADHVDDFPFGRKGLLAAARHDADRWLDDGGSCRDATARGSAAAARLETNP